MKKFVFQLVIFLVVFVTLGEVVIRVFKWNIDVPTTFLDKKDKLIKFLPNETGYHSLGHQWQTNDFGYTGNNPKKFDKLITVVGDSFIAGFMNPNDCHQSVYLQKLRPEFNFFPIARQGTGVLEHMQRINSIDSLKPILNLIYVEEKSFLMSIRDFDKENSTTQIMLETGKIHHAKYDGSTLKELLRKFKFGYYFYRQFVLKKDPEQGAKKLTKPTNYELVGRFIDYIKVNYNTDNVVFVFRPDSDKKTVELCAKKGLRVLFLKSDDNYKAWSFENDNHWSCVGHDKSSQQVSDFLKTLDL